MLNRLMVLATILVMVLALSLHAAAGKVVVWYWDFKLPSSGSAYGAGLQEALDRFAELHPDIEIELDAAGGLDKVITAIAAGTQPDIAAINGFLLKELSMNGYVEQLDSYLSPDTTFKPEYMAPGHWDMVHGFDGGIYGASALTDAIGFWSLYYNREHLALAGYDRDTPPRTWEEVRDYVTKLTRYDGDKYVQLGYGLYDWLAYETHHWVRAANLSYFTPDGREALLDQPGMADVAHFLTSIGDAVGGWENVDASGARASLTFEQGGASMVAHGEWLLEALALGDLVWELNVPHLLSGAPNIVEALDHFLTARDRVARTYTLEGTPIQAEWVDIVNNTFRDIILNRLPPESVLGETDRILQAKLDEAWALAGK